MIHQSPHPNPKPRRRRVHIQLADDPTPLEDIQQGIPALNLLATFPALTSWQVCKVLFLNQPNKDNAVRTEGGARKATNRDCLRPLKDLGLVKVKQITRKKDSIAKWELNYLTKAGHEALAEYRAAHNQAPPPPYQPPTRLKKSNIDQHHMDITDIGVAAYAAALRSGSVSVDLWLDDMTIRSLSKQGRIHWPMEPDFLLVLRYQQWRVALFGELDRGTTSVDSPRANSWETKMLKYKQYYAAERKLDPWLKDFPHPPLLTVAESIERMNHLQKTTADRGGRSAYHFTTREWLEPPYSFFDAVWQRIGLDGYHSILDQFSS